MFRDEAKAKSLILIDMFKNGIEFSVGLLYGTKIIQ